MTKQQKQIIKLREQGYKYSDIAIKLGLSQSSVRMFCTRHGVGAGGTHCKNCGSSVPNGYTTFCSKSCRDEWWKKNRHLVYRYEYSFVCKHCGKKFTRSFNNHQKYCSFDCYLKDRYQKGEEE